MSSPLADRMSRFLRADVQGMHGYAVQPSAGFVKVDTMENPFRLPPALRRELGERLADVALNRYPAERGDVLRAALARHADMPADCDIMLGNGSDELISLLTLAADVAGNVVLAPLPGFVMYELAAKLQGLRFVGVPLTADFELDVPAMLAAIREHRPALVHIAYPNNPTANLWDDAAIDAIVEAAPGLVVIDEAYQPFAARDSLERLRRHEHVLLMRTLSKFGLAGVRLGYLMGPAAIVAEIDKLRPPYNISVLNCEAALFALEHVAEYANQAATIRAERAKLAQAIAALPGALPFPQRGQHDPGPRAGREARLRRHEGPWRVDQERFRPAPAARQLHPHHDRHARRESADPRRPARRVARPRTEDDRMTNEARIATVQRDTKETKIRVRVDLDGTGSSKLQTGIGFFDHMLDQIARHGLIDLEIEAAGDLHIDGHHTVEDVGITLGQAVAQAVGDKKGLTRYGHAYEPLDEALSRVVVVFSGRPGLHMDVAFKVAMIRRIRHAARVRVLPGLLEPCRRVAAHRQPQGAERPSPGRDVIFKAFGRALRMAMTLDERSLGVIPSTKGTL